MSITDPKEWGEAVERAAAAMAGHMWGPPHWYRGPANAALSAALGLDPKEMRRVVWAYHDVDGDR